MAQLKASIVVDLTGNLPATSKAFAGALKRLGITGAQDLARVSRAAELLGKRLDDVGNQYTALLGGAAVAGAARYVATLESRLTRLGIAAGKSDKEMHTLQERIFDVSQQKNIRIAPEELQSAVEKIVEKTGDLDMATANLENMAMAIQASGAGGAQIGAMFADMAEKFQLKTPQEFLEAMDTLVNQGKSGAFTLQAMATQGERVTAAYAAIGRTGPAANREMGALLQAAKKGTGSEEQAATAFERLLAELLTKGDDLKKIGVQLWDPEQLKLGKKVARSVPDVVKEIMKATKGDPEKISQIFGDEAKRALTAIQIEFKETGGFSSLDSFLNVTSDGTALLDDSARAARGLDSALTNLHTAWKRFGSDNLSAPIQSLADTLNSLDPETAQTGMKAAVGVAGAVGAVVAARKLYTLGKDIAGAIGYVMNGKPGDGSGPGAGGIGVQKVFVVNWPLGMLGDGDSSDLGMFEKKKAGSGAAAAGRKGLLARLGGAAGAAKWGGRALGAAGLVLTAAEAAQLLSSDAPTSEKVTQGAGLAGQLAGGLGGMKAGAALGTMVAPGVGTLVGGALGGLVGSMAGEWLASSAAKAAQEPAQAEVGGKVSIEVNGLPPGSRVSELSAYPNAFGLDVSAGPMRVGR